MSEDKFSKSIDDEQLDQIAGGTKKEIQKDIAFLNVVGVEKEISLPKNASENDVRAAWAELGINATTFYDSDVENLYTTGIGKTHQNHTRQDAMIIAMRNARHVVDLDKYL